MSCPARGAVVCRSCRSLSTAFSRLGTARASCARASGTGSGVL